VGPAGDGKFSVFVRIIAPKQGETSVKLLHFFSNLSLENGGDLVAKDPKLLNGHFLEA
jgi:hypothetical protein